MAARLRLSPSSLVLVLLLSLAAPARAGFPPIWTPVGPDGGAVVELHGNYAVTASGLLLKTLPLRRGWFVPAKSPPGKILRLEVLGGGDRLYALTAEGFFKNDYGGRRSWDRITIPSMAERPDGLVMAAGRDSWMFVSFGEEGRVYRSQTGRVWRASRALGRRIQVLATHPRRVGVLFAGTSHGLYRTTDWGRTWQRWGLRGRSIVALAIDWQEPERMYAVRRYPGVLGDYTVDLSWSADGGRTWTDSPEILGFGPAVLATPAEAGTAYLGLSNPVDPSLWRTLDGGRHWESLPVSGPVLTLDGDWNSLYVGRAAEGADVLLRSDDQGATWSPAGMGLRALDTSKVVPDPVTAGALYALSRCCLWWTAGPRAFTWQKLWQKRDEWTNVELEVLDLAFDPADPATLYLATEAGLLQRRPGQDWAHLGPVVSCVTPDAADPGRILACDASTGRWGIMEALDGAPPWQTLRGTRRYRMGWITLVPPSAVGAAALYTNAFGSVPGDSATLREQIRRTTDDGATWETLLVLPGLHDTFNAFAFDPQDPRTLLAAYDEKSAGLLPVTGGVARSRDAGATWELISVAAGAPPVLSLALDPTDPSRVYAGSWRGTVYASDDGGTTWSPLGIGLPPLNVVDLRIDPHDPDTLYAATAGGSIYQLKR